MAEYTPNYTCVYIYDESGAIIGVKYISTSAGSSWQTYFFEKNMQGDVIAVYSDTGTKLVSYRYDAWGNVTTTYHNGGASTLAANNPIRYRSYYYDTALQMYYLQSRYYDAKICRFINADSYVSTGQGLTGYNMFAYCGNNPVMRVDPSGEIWWVLFADDIFQLALLTLCTLGIVWLAQDAAGDQILGNLFSDVVTQTAEAVDNLVDGIKSFSNSKADEKEEVNPNPPSGTIIYRYYSTKEKNLAPRLNKDWDGLSFKTVPPTNGAPYTITTIEQINSTGILIAIRKGEHVSVMPTNGTILEWMEQGMDSIWSRTLSEIVVEWE
ncbi:MAG: RHS repeat-associated core domain-containing protein [Clostridia bacterium]|nr:RHS repeat-associated core domain-containing protein [Clostridia bacterium]